MGSFFSAIYDILKQRRSLFYLLFFGSFLFFLLTASQIRLEEDISKFFPNNKKVETAAQVFQGSRFMERIVFMVSLNDLKAEADPDKLIAFTDSLVERLGDLSAHIKTIKSRVDDEVVLSMFDMINDHLPVFLEEKDFHVIDSLLQPDNMQSALANSYQQVITPAGVIMKRVVARDPLGYSSIILKKMQSLQYDENYILYDNYILTKDYQHLVFFVLPVHPPSETGMNIKFIESLDELLHNIRTGHPEIDVQYFGTAAVAVGNARQLRKDSYLTVSLMIVILLVFFVWFFRKKRVPFLILIPVFFGGAFSLSCIYLVQGYISVLAIAAGSIVLGVAVNYSLHFFSHLREEQNIRKVIQHLARPMTIGSITTVLAFLSLQFANASILRDIGLFAGFSLVGAALCSLIFLPHMVKDTVVSKSDRGITLLDRLSTWHSGYSRYGVWVIFLLTPVFLYFARDVRFNSDMNKLNYMSPELTRVQESLNAINEFALRSVYIVTTGSNRQQVLQHNEAVRVIIDSLKKDGVIRKVSTVSDFLISDSLQQVRIQRWNDFWTPEKINRAVNLCREQGRAFRFAGSVYDNFESMLRKSYRVLNDQEFNTIKNSFFGDYMDDKESPSIVTLARVDPDDRHRVYEKLDPLHHTQAVDRQMLTSMFVEYLNEDFSFIVGFTSILVFVTLLVSMGRIEITIITFLPMLITWIWILGIMALSGIEFNIINVMISTFIFGLGDDYSIFIMDGLQQRYKSGRESLPSIKVSIFLSAFTTIAGLGVLIFAEHPALRSIAAIAIIGIVCVFVMAQTIEPFLFSWFISNRARKKLSPMTAWGFSKSVFAFGFFAIGSFVLTIIGLILVKGIPVYKKRVRYFYHRLVSLYTWSLLYIMGNLKKVIENKESVNFRRPQIIICNHQSFMDILVTVMQHPALILLVNRWVYNSPVFGGVVRLAGYYPVIEGVDTNLDYLRRQVEDGYSILVFPEGTRSPDASVRRFHKGAFYLAENLNLPVLPFVLHGTHNTMAKGDFYLNDAQITMRFLPLIMPDDKTFGVSYQERTKLISAYFKEEYRKLAQEVENPDYYRYKLIRNYLYKGPVLEWYLRIKLSLEKNYKPFDNLIPRDASVLDLGCGYGFLCLMLHFLSPARSVRGVDYDPEKIDTANHCYSKGESLHFECSDIASYKIETQVDIIVLSDVLHYLNSEQQVTVLEHCIASLTPGGKLIIRDGDKDNQEKHRRTRITEFFSIRLLKFNKSVQALNFMSGADLCKLASKNQCHFEIIEQSRHTSNAVFVIRKDELN